MDQVKVRVRIEFQDKLAIWKSGLVLRCTADRGEMHCVCKCAAEFNCVESRELRITSRGIVTDQDDKISQSKQTRIIKSSFSNSFVKM